MSKSKKPYSGSLQSNLEAFFSSTSSTDNSTQTLPIEQIVLPAYQPRQYFDPDTLQELADSIKKHGILEPLLVRPLSEGNTHELVAGGRRYRAAQLAQLAVVPVVIKNFSDIEASEIALIENLAREDLNPVEETEGILRLLEIKLHLEREPILSLLYRMTNEAKGKVTQNVLGSSEAETVKAVFEPLGMSWQSFISSRLPLLKLPDDILETLRQGKLAYTKAQAIAKVKDETGRDKLLEDAIAHNLSLSQIRERVKELQSSPQVSTPQKRVNRTAKRINSSKLWELDPKKWNKIESLLEEIDKLMTEEAR